MRKATIFLLVSFVFLYGCSVNPVTGKRELVLMSTAQEIEMGKQNYAPMQQSQGGAYDVDPVLTDYVQRVGQSVAAQSGVNLPYEFVVLNNGVPNAWALPGGKIAINRGLLTEMESEAELAAVLGHEAVHAAARHSAKQQSRAMLMQVGVLGTAIAASDSDYGGLIVGGANILAQAGLAKYGRSAELESDYYGMQYMSKAGYDPQGAVALQETFVRLSEGRRSDWLSGLFASHPPSMERVRANQATASALPAGGTRGEREYQAAMRKTIAIKPAYDAYDEGRKALAEKDMTTALAKANQALSLFPDEAHFHALRGDIRLMEDNFDWAVTNYSRAIDRRDSFFYYHLQRGLARKELGQTDAAVNDLENSIALLPTAPAHYALGDIAKARGNRAAAIEHYKVVAQSGGEYGKAATGELVRLDMPSNPGAYVNRGCSADGNGNLIVSVRNETSVQVRGVQVVVQYNDSAGRPVQKRFNVSGELAPGQVASVNTGMGPYTASSGCPAEVVAAEVVE
ncbi:MAG: tetratricopeptide repeat protein [Chromatiales bacterium]|nr:MAG: tetratricopeptide repeat protein [Chromatiales bacterium]